jgi:STAS domain
VNARPIPPGDGPALSRGGAHILRPRLRGRGRSGRRRFGLPAAALEKLRTTPKPVRLVVCDLSTTPYVDVTSALMLMGLQANLRAAEIEFRLVEARATVRDLLRAGGLEARMGSVSRRISLDDLVESFRKPAGGEPKETHA